MFRHYCVIPREFAVSNLPRISHICVTWQGAYYELPEDDTIVSKHVGVIIFQLTVHLLVSVLAGISTDVLLAIIQNVSN